jgi:hypothetical protein
MREPTVPTSFRQSRWTVLILAAGLSGFSPPLAAQTEYMADGAPTALEEEIRWLMNRGRFDSARENTTRGTSYADVPANAPPLAPHQALTLASRHHSEDMARQNLFQHETVPGSSYYNATTQPLPWDRMTAEGYSWSQAAENIAAGYGSAEVAYVGWWNSTGHRLNMYDTTLREVGNGYFYLASSTYGRYYTMDLGRSGGTHFFTDTMFRDADGDGTYDQNEAIAGIRLRLRVGGVIHSWYDVSSTVGSFAVPIQAIADGSNVEVLLANPTAATLTLGLPRDYSGYSQVSLATGEEIVVGTFTQPSSAVNLGFRNLSPAPPPITPPLLALARAGSNVQLRWSAQAGVLYVPQWTTNLTTWNDLVAGSLTGTGAEMTFTNGLTPAGTAYRFFRLIARSP